MTRRVFRLILVLAVALFPATVQAQTLSGTVQFGGDVLIHDALLADAYDTEQDAYDFTHMFEPVAPLLSQTDLTVLNLEVPIAKGTYSGYPMFNSPPALLDAIAQTGTDLLLCANNHALDRLGKGARQTIEQIEATGLSHIGTARNREEFNAVPLYDVGGIRVAIFNYTQHTNGMQEKDTEANLRYAVHYFAVHRAEKDILAAREAGADYVILCVHWGREYEREPTKGVRQWAQELCDAGADLIIGGHPHVLQGYETLQSTNKKTGEVHDALVLYSMGNFLSGQRDQYRDTGALFRFTLEKDTASGETRLASHGYIPTWVWLDAETESYRVLPLAQAIDAPPEGMAASDIARMREALAETTSHMGPEYLLEAE